MGRVRLDNKGYAIVPILLHIVANFRKLLTSPAWKSILHQGWLVMVNSPELEKARQQ